MRTLEEVVEVWMDGKPPATQRNYRNVIKNAGNLAAVKYGKDLPSLDKFELQRVATELTSKCQPNAKGTVYAILRSFFNSVQALEVRPDNPAIHLKKPKTPNRTAQKIMSLKEVQWLVAVATGETRLLIQTLYGAGLRAGEVCGLKVGDFNYERRTLFVIGKGSKERTVTISPSLAEKMEVYLRNRHPNEPLFKSEKNLKDGSARPLSPQSVWRVIKHLAKKAGIRGIISPHWLRHTHATHAIENGMNIRDLSRTLGHSSVGVTEKFYDHAITKSSPSEFLPVI